MPTTDHGDTRRPPFLDQLIDHHLHLRQLVDELLWSDEVVDGRALEACATYFRAMLVFEEAVMSCHGYPLFSEHHRSHRQIVTLLVQPGTAGWHARLAELLHRHCCRDDGLLALHLMNRLPATPAVRPRPARGTGGGGPARPRRSPLLQEAVARNPIP